VFQCCTNVFTQKSPGNTRPEHRPGLATVRYQQKKLHNSLGHFFGTGSVRGIVNSMIHLNSPEIYITCDKHPETVFSDPVKMDNQNRLRQMLRRIDEIIHLEPKVVEYEDDFE